MEGYMLGSASAIYLIDQIKISSRRGMMTKMKHMHVHQ